MKIRVGYGYDVHQLAAGEEFWLGGIQVEHTHGAVGHSDADVLIHVICDALLGGAGLGDIGKHFPDTDECYLDIDSRKMLRHIVTLLRDLQLTPGNVDATIVAQQPMRSDQNEV